MGRIKHCAIFLAVLLGVVTMCACNKLAKTGNKGSLLPSVTAPSTPFPLTTITPAPTPVPLKETVLSHSWFDECKVIDCEEYYFEVLSFIELNEGGYAIETVFENRLQFDVAIAISDVHINFLKPTLFEGGVDWEEKVIEQGEKKKIEFGISDAYAKRLRISDVTDFNCVQFDFTVEAVVDAVVVNDYYDINWIMFYSYGREHVNPYEHVPANDDIVLVDHENVKLYLTDFIYDEDGNCYVYYYLENVTAELLWYKFYSKSLNGRECNKVLNYFEEVNIDSGMGGYDFFIIQASDIKKSGNASVTDFELEVYLYYDAAIWQWKDLVHETFNVYPSEHRAVQKVEKKPNSENIVLFDTDYYKMVYNGFSTEKRQIAETVYTDYYIHVFIENKSAQTLRFIVSDATINGEIYANEYNFRSMFPGESKDVKFKWEDLEGEFDDFPNLKSLELAVQIKNLDDEMQSVIFEESFTLIP